MTFANHQIFVVFFATLLYFSFVKIDLFNSLSRTYIYKNAINFLVVMLCRYHDAMMAAECLRLSFSLSAYAHPVS